MPPRPILKDRPISPAMEFTFRTGRIRSRLEPMRLETTPTSNVRSVAPFRFTDRPADANRFPWWFGFVVAGVHFRDVTVPAALTLLLLGWVCRTRRPALDLPRRGCAADAAVFDGRSHVCVSEHRGGPPLANPRPRRVDRGRHAAGWQPDPVCRQGAYRYHFGRSARCDRHPRHPAGRQAGALRNMGRCGSGLGAAPWPKTRRSTASPVAPVISPSTSSAPFSTQKVLSINSGWLHPMISSD